MVIQDLDDLGYSHDLGTPKSSPLLDLTWGRGPHFINGLYPQCMEYRLLILLYIYGMKYGFYMGGSIKFLVYNGKCHENG